jgi:NADH-quinone oxidoreductase subunit L
MASTAVLLLLAPLLGFSMILVLGRQLREPAAGWIGTTAIGVAFVAAIATFVELLSRSDRVVTVQLFRWLDVGSLHANAALLVDPLSVTMCLFITGISMLIHLYSVSYMQGERDFNKYFIYLNLFVFSMVLLVLANNLVLTFVGWEGVGVCSYWLVAYYFDRDSAASAGKKAFIYNRVGDVGLLIAMFLLFRATHTLDYLGIFSASSLHALSPTVATLTVLALLLAATGKSAQIPLFNWLPDAMEGPTPVSALIHAATMVTAGVYLLVRMSPVLALSGSGRMTIAVIGGVTAFVAATIATSQRDIKKVLAFSTVSQIGYMVMAVGAGAYGAAIFLMVCHASYKALLFLGSGSVIHSLHGEQDLHVMGGLAKWLPLTFPTFLVGWLTICGVPPFSGFWSKGDVLANVWGYSRPLWALGVVTAVLTAYYMSRLFVLTFRGNERFREITHGSDPHESDWIMTAPLLVLAGLTVLAGVLDLPWIHHDSIAGFLSASITAVPGTSPGSTNAQWVLATVDVAAAVIGIVAAFAVWRRVSPWPTKYEPRFLEHVWYWDDAYDATIGRPAEHAAAFAGDVVEDDVIDGAVRGVASGVRRSAEGLRRAQSGFLRHYALATVLGMAVLILYLLTRSW